MNLSKLISLIVNVLADIFYPKKCIVCNSYVNIGTNIYMCHQCRQKLNKYGKAIRDGGKYFDEAIAALPFDKHFKDVMTDFKFRNFTCYSKTFAYVIYNKVRNHSFIKDALICPVPIHPLRNREYNQAFCISDELSKYLGLKCIPDLLIKIRNVEKLSGMNYALRQISVKGAIAFNLHYNIVGKRIILVDDIYTTGSTTNECSKILKMYGASEVYVLSAMYAVEKKEAK